MSEQIVQKPGKLKEGWGFPLLSKKSHFFINGMSLCRKWMYAGHLEDPTSSSPDDCAQCKKLLAKHRESIKSAEPLEAQ